MTIDNLRSADGVKSACSAVIDDVIDEVIDWPAVAESVRATLNRAAKHERWTTIPQGHGSTDDTSTPAAAAHLVKAVLPSSQSERRLLLHQLWRSVDVGGYLALSFDHHRTPVGYNTVVADLLEASLGRVLTEQLVVHPDPRGGVSDWATAVWVRLGPSADA